METKQNPGKKALPILFTLAGCLIPVFIILIVYSIYRIPEKDKSSIIQLTGVWKIQEGLNPDWTRPGLDDSGWKEIKLPGSFYNQGFHEKYLTLRKDFTLNTNMENQDLFLFIGGTGGSMGMVYMNGFKIGEIGMIVNGRKTQGADEKFGFYINKHNILNGAADVKNTISIEFDTITPSYDGVQDPRILLGTYNSLRSYYEKNISASLFFQYGIIFTGIFALIILFLLLMTEWGSPNRNKYVSTIFFVFSAILYNLFFTNVFVRYVFDTILLSKLLILSIVFLCPATLDYVQYFFTNKTNILSKINRVVCLLVVVMVFAIQDFVIVKLIHGYFIMYFFVVIVYICAFCVAHTLKAREKYNAVVITVSIIIGAVSGISDLLTNLGLIHMPLLFSITISIFIVMSAMVIIADFIKISDYNKTLSLELSQLNVNLEAKVSERTKELSQANEKLKKLDTVKNDFIANITHDFRSPLTVILNTADLNLKEHKDNPYKSEFEMILSSSYRMKNYIDRLLDLAKMDAGAIKLKIRKTDIVQFLETIASYYQSAIINTNIKIITSFPEIPVENFYTDEEKLDEVISNILSNAIKYVSIENGIIEIEVRDEPDTVLIIISDNGIGIPEDKLEFIFERFEQLESGRNTKFSGSGIGLAFAKQLVEFMKGKIWAESGGENKGSRFMIRLPRGKAAFDDQEISTESMKATSLSRFKKLVEYDIGRKIQKEELEFYIKERNKENEFVLKKSVILIIDDEKSIAGIVMNYLLINGFENFIIANNGKTGLKAVYQYTPDVILCDYNMPGAHGQ